jgi:tetratricopeptide (TPR) repeat protein
MRLLPAWLFVLAACGAAVVTGGCGAKDKKAATTPGASTTVTTEDVTLMSDGADVGDARGSDEPGGAAGDKGKGSSAAGGGDKATGKNAKKPADKPEPPKIEPPDLDIGASAQRAQVAQHLELARSALARRQPDPDLAIREARAALTADAANIDAVVLMAHAYCGKRLYDTAEVMLDMMLKARKRAKQNPGLYYVYGLIYDHTKRPDKAMVAYRRAVELRPDYQSALVNLGVHHLRNQRFAEAIAVYEKLTGQLGLTTALVWTNLGSAYRGHSGDYGPDSPRRGELLQQAETAYKRALSVDRNYANSYYNLGLLYLDAEVFPGPGGAAMDKLKRLERSKTYFDEYKAMSGADIDLVADRVKQVDKLIKRETKRRKREQEKQKKQKKQKNTGGDDDW